MKGSIKYSNNDTIVIGHNPYYAKNCVEKPRLDTTKSFDKTHCVVHLLSSVPGLNADTMHADDHDDCNDRSDHNDNKGWDENKLSNNGSNKSNEKVKIISDHITDQNPDLWKIMKRGDLVEIIGYRRSDRLYIVDKDPAPKDLGIIKNGLILKPLYTEYDQYGTIYPDMFSITEFQLGYFDQVVINDYFAQTTDSIYSTYSSYSTCPMERPGGWWRNTKSPVCFNVKKLKLNRLTRCNVFTTTNKIVGKESYQVNHLYAVIKYKAVDYLIIRECSNKYFAYCVEKELERFINLFKKTIFIECYDIDDLHESVIKSIALEENVGTENTCCI